MTLIDDIKWDREAGTPGPWVARKSSFEVFNVDHGPIRYEVASGYTLIAALYSDDIDADASGTKDSHCSARRPQNKCVPGSVSANPAS